jgi:hypothetical protein
MASGGRAVVEQMANHCSAAGELADRLSLSADVRAGIEQSYALGRPGRSQRAGR